MESESLNQHPSISIRQVFLKEFHQRILHEIYQQAWIGDLPLIALSNLQQQIIPVYILGTVSWEKKAKTIPITYQSPPFFILIVGILIMQSYLIDLKI